MAIVKWKCTKKCWWAKDGSHSLPYEEGQVVEVDDASDYQPSKWFVRASEWKPEKPKIFHRNLKVTTNQGAKSFTEAMIENTTIDKTGMATGVDGDIKPMPMREMRRKMVAK